MIPPIEIAVQRDEKTGRHVLLWDASLYNDSNCRRKVFFKLVKGVREGEKDFKMEYGTAFHKHLVAFYSGATLEQCVNEAFGHYSQPDIHVPDTDWRNLAHLVNCVNQYYTYWKKNGDLIVPLKDNNGKPILEKKFSFPFYRTERTEVLLSGTMDFIGTFASQFAVVVDHKTTSLTGVDNYLNGYCLSPQLMTYKMIHDTLFGGDVSCMINGIFLSRTNKNTFKRSELFSYTKDQMQQFRRHLLATVKDVVDKFEIYLTTGDDSVFEYNYTCCKEEYGMCEFSPLCRSNKEDVAGLIGMNFTTLPYNPLAFQT